MICNVKGSYVSGGVCLFLLFVKLTQKVIDRFRCNFQDLW